MSLFSSLSVSASGMSAQRARAELLVENLANAETTRTPEGGPYRRKDVVFSSQGAESPFASLFESQLSQPQGVGVSEIIVDTRDPERRYLPGHPDADKDGYVSYPNIDMMTEFVNAVEASRAYEANLGAVDMTKQLVNLSLKILA